MNDQPLSMPIIKIYAELAQRVSQYSVDTKLAAGITRIFPKFKDHFEAISVRVPTTNVTAIDLSVTVHDDVCVEKSTNYCEALHKGIFVV